MSHNEPYRRTPHDLSNLRKCGVPPASVHPPEITGDEISRSISPDGDASVALLQNFRHSGWAKRRQLIWQALQRRGVAENRLERFRNCGSHPFVYRSIDPPHLYKLHGNYCHDRFCVPCNKDRARLVTMNLAGHLEGKDLRFITLTQRDNGEDLCDLIKHIQSSFKRLRATPAWKERVYGGVVFTEIKRNTNPAHWHVHLHMIVEGRYFPQPLLKSLWQTASRGSTIVDIRAVQDAWGGAHEVAKYAGKPMDLAIAFKPDLILEAIDALDSRRLFTSFGQWRNLKLSEHPQERTFEPFCSLAELLAKHHHGVPGVSLILAQLGLGVQPDPNHPLAGPRPPPEPVSSVVRETQALLTNTPTNGAVPIPWSGRGLPF